MEPLRVVVRRGAVVEATHLVHAVAVQAGAVVASAGETGLVTYFRSSAKPFQALPVARAREDLDDRDLAIASASHLARPEQLAAVEALLAKAPATEEDLECGTWDGSRLRHNCSGKHAGMLALCHARGWATRGYRLPDHPLQLALLAEIATAAQVDARAIATAVDGCGVVTFGLTIERMAHAFSRLERIEGGRRVIGAMRAHPELVRGPGEPDTIVMQRLPGWAAKAGAEGLICACGPDGLGIALKVVDGADRAVAPALSSFLAELGHEVEELRRRVVQNSRGEPVGAIASE
ncbi:MAG TPA: asparaginase [Gaiellaceae bacterium]